jgi:hypothetical protein
MKVAFHSYQLGSRGSEICLYKYAKFNRSLLGNESIIISTSSRPLPTLERFTKEFPVFLYPDVWAPDRKNEAINKYLKNLVKEEKIDFLYAITGGENDGLFNEETTGCRTGVHAIFRMDEPHGSVYAGVCEYISQKHGGNHPHVDHIVDYPKWDPQDNLRASLGIPENALVLGRHGGNETFNLSFAYGAVEQALQRREDLWFVFLNTNKFINHPRAIFLPWTGEQNEILRFVATCDAMLHARYDGEIFPLTCAEFSTQNKPIISWDPLSPPSHYDTGHLAILGDKVLGYKDGAELLHLILGLDRNWILSEDWNVYKDNFSPEKVMKQFKEVFLDKK